MVQQQKSFESKLAEQEKRIESLTSGARESERADWAEQVSTAHSVQQSIGQ
jgi:hypothetical protein